MKPLYIIDMYGNEITVTDLDKAISQASADSESPYKQTPFVLKGYHSEVIKGRENETYTVGEYNVDLLDKLRAVKEGFAVSSTVSSNLYGYKDYDILNHPLFHRAKVSLNIKKGDVFNAYYGRSCKMGVVWQGGLIKSLVMSGLNETEYTVKTHVDKEPEWYSFIGEDALRKALESFKEQGVITMIEQGMTSEVYNLELLIEGESAVVLKAKNVLSKEDTLMDSLVWTKTNIDQETKDKVEKEILKLINSGVTYKDNFIPGFSFVLDEYKEDK